MTEQRIDEGLVERVAEAILARQGFGFYSNPMEGGQDAYDISCEALEDARAALEASGLAALQQENEALREALKPFAKSADIRLCGEWADDKHFSQTDVGFALTFGDLRKARAALQPDLGEDWELAEMEKSNDRA